MTGEPPAGKVILFRDRIIVAPAPGREWRELVDLRLFGKFVPGITFDEAKARFGEPTKEGATGYGPYLVYERPGSAIYLAREEHRSGKDTYKTWTLRAYPTRAKVEDLLNPVLVRYVDRKSEHTELFILGYDGEPVVDIAIQRSMVKSITWLRL